jgi:hypothetical protein
MELKARELGAISLEQKGIYDDYLRRYPTEISEQSFTNLFMWRKSRPIKAIEVGDSLLAYEERDDGVIMFGQPIGPLPLRKAIETIRKVSGKDVALCDRIFENAVSPDVLKDYEAEEDRDYFDYTYSRKGLSDLEGRRYSKKRNLIKQCLAENRCKYEEIDGENIAEVSAMMDRWCDYRDCHEDKGLCNEFRATREIFQNYSKLDVIGATIRIDGRIEAFTVGERLNDNTAVIHLEKAMPEYKGLYQLINQWFCKNHLASFDFVNREQDVGMPGLRQAKESYYPERMIRKFKVYPLGKERSRLKEPAEFKRCLDEEG